MKFEVICEFRNWAKATKEHSLNAHGESPEIFIPKVTVKYELIKHFNFLVISKKIQIKVCAQTG